MPNGWIFVLLVMGERMIISICVGEMDLFFFFKQGQSTYGLVELCKGPNSLLTWLLISISVLINP